MNIWKILCETAENQINVAQCCSNKQYIFVGYTSNDHRNVGLSDMVDV